LESKTDPSLNGLFHAISFQIVGIAIALIANSTNFAFLLFADTHGHEIALCVPILATALFTIVWVDATLQSQVANIKDATDETKNSHAYKYISTQPYILLRLMNLFLAVALAASQLSILFGGR
tara:strand:- start:654 stop:1022 length:369 start_codon:yes stop_codon:yes gene_type:complete